MTNPGRWVVTFVFAAATPALAQQPSAEAGRIAKLAPDSIRLETPAAIVGVRGTSLAIRVEPR